MTHAVVVRDIGKRFRRVSDFSHGPAGNFRELLRQMVGGLLAPASTAAPDYFWAIRHLNFEIDHGEVVGIVGRNGAGKSTLLKILSRITAPSEGEARLFGRVGALLEVGTGFHDELTGRENVFMNGAILGMTNPEIQKQFDAIIDFAGVEDFIDMPIKRYSSGMKARLAFSVAAHLEPEILIVDEVLAVGDAKFQRKCLNLMGDVAKTGRTVLFVSHNISAVRRLCTRGILLRDGGVAMDTKDVDAVIAGYLEADEIEEQPFWRCPDDYSGGEFIRPLSFRLAGGDGQTLGGLLSSDREIWVEMEAFSKKGHPALFMGYALYNKQGDLLFTSCSHDHEDAPDIPAYPAHLSFRARLPSNLLGDGEYSLHLLAGVRHEEQYLWLQNSFIRIKLAISGNLIQSGAFDPQQRAMLAPVLNWQLSVGSPND